MSEPITLTAIIEFNSGKQQRFQELFATAEKYVREHEPFTWTYECVWGKKDPSAGEITEAVIREVYENQASMDKHAEGFHVKAILEAVEKESLFKSVKVVYTGADKAGFSSRS